MNDVVIIGGGLAGLVNSILLKRAGFSVLLFEEKKYPFHRVCGEYVSNEVIPFLRSQNLFPDELKPSNISRFQLTSISGKGLEMPLDLGGFGVSRYAFDHWLSKVALSEGVSIIHQRIVQCEFLHEHHSVTTKDGDRFQAKVAIGAFGKRSTLDKSLNRKFLTKRSPYVGVKYHLKTDLIPNDLIALHNFENGYCGISRVENDVSNMCYLSHRSNLKATGSIPKIEQAILYQNPYLKEIFNSAKFLLERPEVINEITFEKKEPVFGHILMSGDSAGMITPLCGNGMAMAIHSAKMLSELVTKNFENGFNREKLEKDYTSEWNKNFANRLAIGRSIQQLFGSGWVSNSAISLARVYNPFAKFLMKQTHGQPF